MGASRRAVATPVPSPRLERAAGAVARSVVITLLPAWAVWLLTHTGPFPPWVWVFTLACPALFSACRARCGRGERPPGGSREQVGTPAGPGRS